MRQSRVALNASVAKGRVFIPPKREHSLVHLLCVESGDESPKVLNYVQTSADGFSCVYRALLGKTIWWNSVQLNSVAFH